MALTTEQRVERLIAKKGGRRLDSGWHSVDDKIEVQCRAGHIWAVKASSLLYAGTWCSKCQIEGRRIGIDKISAIAAERGGRCLSETYENSHERLLWRCRNGHGFTLSTKMVLRGSWCPECRNANGGSKHIRSFGEAVAKARKKGGEHIGECKRLTQKTKWRCRKGHEFEASGTSILRRSFFCPSCDGRRPTTLETVKEECRKRGGDCLSKEYVSLSSPMEFQCGKGHVWTARWRNVGLNKSWCPFCSKHRGDISILREIAEKEEGRVLSTQYVNARTVYEWECKSGHFFRATKKEAEKSWCKQCSNPMSAYERIAEKHNGKLILGEKDQWECKNGHRWRAPLSEAAMAWCPMCLGESSDKRAECDDAHPQGALPSGDKATIEAVPTSP